MRHAVGIAIIARGVVSGCGQAICPRVPIVRLTIVLSACVQCAGRRHCEEE